MIENLGVVSSVLGIAQKAKNLLRKEDRETYIVDAIATQLYMDHREQRTPFYELTIEIYALRPLRLHEIRMTGCELAHHHFATESGPSGLGEFVPDVLLDESLWSPFLILDCVLRPSLSDRNAKISFWCRRVNVCDSCEIMLDDLQFSSSHLSSLLLNPPTM